MRLFGGLIKRALTLGDKVQGIGMTPYDYQRKTLRRLLRKAEFTAFGQHYNFSGILASPDIIEAFRNRVPLFDYDKMHDAWWHRSLENEADVSWRGKTKYFALSSGTSGAPSKYLPMTDDMVKTIRKSSLKLFFKITKFDIDSEFFTHPGLFVGSSASLREQNDYYIGDMSGISMRERPFWVQIISRPSTRIQAITDWNERTNAIARNAKKWDISYITGIPSWVQLVIERVMSYHEVDNIHEIWPNLQVYVHGGIAFEPHRKAFDALMGKPMVYIDTYLASEGYIAFQARPDTRGMALILNNGIFHEFIPFNEQNFDSDGVLKGSPKSLAIHEVQEGVEYALVISTCGGAWRYLIGDTVRFTDAQRKEIIITGRTKHFLSVTGEHLSVDNMNQGIRHASETLDIDVKEFVVAAIRTPTGFAHRWYVGSDSVVDTAKFTQLMDGHLCDINDDYATERKAVLRDPQVHIVPSSFFYEFLKSKGKIGGQAKFPRVMKSEPFAEWENFVASKLANNQSTNNQ
ncbi:MAG: GH3 auxin-responsive promoter family protein [Saprospiraceae bacterium]|nr:GH3 auxin-responsive promoter family protein [Saprospiraceae bacterium]